MNLVLVLIVVQIVPNTVILILAMLRVSVKHFTPLLGIEDAISPLRMGIMINVELSFHVYRLLAGNYSYRKLSLGFNLAAFNAGTTPDANPTTIATVTESTTGHSENGT